MKWPFGKRKSRALEILEGAEWQCASCTVAHHGMFDLAARAPAQWTKEEIYDSNAALRMDEDFLSEDFCVLNGEHFLVRSVLEIPVHGLQDTFGYGLWGSLKKENFEIYVEHFDLGEVPDGVPWDSWLCNVIHPFMEEGPLPCLMLPRPERQRPLLYVADDDHPLAKAQEDGISPEQLLEIYAHYGHPVAN